MKQCSCRLGTDSRAASQQNISSYTRQQSVSSGPSCSTCPGTCSHRSGQCVRPPGLSDNCLYVARLSRQPRFHDCLTHQADTIFFLQCVWSPTSFNKLFKSCGTLLSCPLCCAPVCCPASFRVTSTDVSNLMIRTSDVIIQSSASPILAVFANFVLAFNHAQRSHRIPQHDTWQRGTW